MTDPEPASDLGYDQVHEDVGRSDRPGSPVAARSGPPAVPLPGDGGEDLGYDDAHDF